MRWMAVSLILLGSGLLGWSVLGSGVIGLSQEGFVLITPERALRYDIRQSISPADLEYEIDRSLLQGNAPDAFMYRDIAEFARIPLSVATIEKLSDAEAETARASIDPLIGPQTEQIHRSLVIEGSKLVAGESFDPFALGLSVAHLTSQPQAATQFERPIGLALINGAYKSGRLNADLKSYIDELITSAVDFSELQNVLTSTRIADRTATLNTLEQHAAKIDSTQLMTLSRTLDELSSRIGEQNVASLLDHIRSPDDLGTLLTMSKVLHNKTYGIVKLTGLRTIEDLPTKIPVKDFLSRNALALAIWTTGLILAALGRRIFRSRWKRLTLDDDPAPEPIDPELPDYIKTPDIKKARV